MTTLSAPPVARGRTTVAELAVERIAAHALTELSSVGGAARTMLGITVGAGAPEQDARVTARVRGGQVRLAVRLSVAYPTSVRAATAAARTHLTERVGALTGLPVAGVDIVVTELYLAGPRKRRVS